MRNRMIAVVVLALAVSAPVALADSCPIIGFQQSGDEPFNVFVGSGSYLGVDTRDVAGDRVAALKLKDESGVEIVAVDQDAPAGKAGLKERDVILTFNNAKVDSVEQLRRMIREVPPGRQVTLGISRDGKAMNVPVALGDRKQMAKVQTKNKGKYSYNYAVPPMPPMPPMPNMSMMGPDVDIPNFNVMVTTSARNGLMVENLTPQLSEFFGVKGGQGGVLVRSVEKGSTAETAGLKAGDVIVRVDKDKIDDLGDWRRAIRSRSGATPVVIVRDKREQTIQMSFPERKNRESGMVTDDEDLDINVNVQELKRELERMRPEIERHTREISMQISNELASHRGEIEKAVAESHKAVAKAMKEQQKELEKAQKELEKELKDSIRIEINED
jgi:serine protease Do